MDVDETTNETVSTLSKDDVQNLKVTELKAALRERSLDDKGLKSALQQRLMDHLEEQANSDPKPTTETPGPPTGDKEDVEEPKEEEPATELEEVDETVTYTGKVKKFNINKFVKVTPDDDFKKFGHKAQTIEISASDILTDMSPAVLTEDQEVEFKLRKDEYGIYGVELTAPGGGNVPEAELAEDAKKAKHPRTAVEDGKVFLGKIAKFMHNRGMGFISFDDIDSFTIPESLTEKQKKRFDKSKELWFHRNDLVSTDPAVGVDEGTEVQFTVYSDERGMGGTNIKLRDDEPVSGWKCTLQRQPRVKKNGKKKNGDSWVVKSMDGTVIGKGFLVDGKVKVKGLDGKELGKGLLLNAKNGGKRKRNEMDDDDADEPDRKKNKREEWKNKNNKSGACRGRVKNYDHNLKRGIIEFEDEEYIVYAWQINKDAAAGVTDETVRLNNNQRVEFFAGKTSSGENLALYVSSKTGGPMKTQQSNNRRGGGRTFQTNDRDNRRGGGRDNGRQRNMPMQRSMPQVQYVMQPMGGGQRAAGRPQMMMMPQGGQMMYTTVPQASMSRGGSFTYVAAGAGGMPARTMPVTHALPTAPQQSTFVTQQGVYRSRRAGGGGGGGGGGRRGRF